MKILCETQLVNRQTQTNRNPRAVKSTLAIGYKNSAKDANGDSNKTLEIVLFTPQNKLGIRYKVRDNIDKIFTKFLLDGKATIGFKQPPENLLIKCDPIQLKGFLQTLKLGIEGKDSINLRLNIAGATAIPQKSTPQHRMVVTKRSEYPLKGFPKSLKSLTINNIQLHKVSFDICSLRNLTSLNIACNNISKLPPEIGQLPLNELRLDHNSLGDTHNWSFLKGRTIMRSLRELDISANKLTYFPLQLIKLEQLVTLKLNNNHIKRLPFGIRRLRRLRYFHLSTNQLESLPSAFDDMCVDTLDIWGNNFQSLKEHSTQSTTATIGTAAPLWLISARIVSQFKLPYTSATLPWQLVDLLSESPKCACGKICYAGSVLERAVMARFVTIKSLVFSRHRHIYEDIVLCGQKCAGRKWMSRGNAVDLGDY